MYVCMYVVSKFNVPDNFIEILKSQTHGPTTQLISTKVCVCVYVCVCVCVCVCVYIWVVYLHVYVRTYI